MGFAPIFVLSTVKYNEGPNLDKFMYTVWPGEYPVPGFDIVPVVVPPELITTSVPKTATSTEPPTPDPPPKGIKSNT